MFRVLYKAVHRRALSFVSTPLGMIVVLVAAVFLFHTTLTTMQLFLSAANLATQSRDTSLSSSSSSSASSSSSTLEAHLHGPTEQCCSHPVDNLIGTSLVDHMCLPVIDIVYTWVNGSDPNLIEDVAHYKLIQAAEDEARVAAKAAAAAQKAAAAAAAAAATAAANSTSASNSTDASNTTSIVHAATTTPPTTTPTTTLVDSSSSAVAHTSRHRRRLLIDPRERAALEAMPSDDEVNGNLPFHADLSDAPMSDDTHAAHDASSTLANAARGAPNATLASNEAHATLASNEAHATIAASATNTTSSINATASATNSSSAANGTAASISESSAGANRFRDNQELRYSLRSLWKFAPWIRRVWIVTNGQVPYWLNLDHPRIAVIAHSDIYPNTSHLPVFSSPSIESHLHRIPGLADRFIYFNDDVMLGNTVWPDDWYSATQGHRVYLSWNVPNCAPGCPDSWLADKYCDAACNNEQCEWDLGDCAAGGGGGAHGPSGSTTHGRYSQWQGTRGRGGADSSTRSHASSPSPSSTNTQTNRYCSNGCPYAWIGDKVCDRSCNNVACGFDGGDCGSEDMSRETYAVMWPRDEAAEVTIPWNVTALYFNLTTLVGTDAILDASHDNEPLVRAAVITAYLHTLSLLLVSPPTDHSLTGIVNTVHLSIIVDRNGTHDNATLTLHRELSPIEIESLDLVYALKAALASNTSDGTAAAAATAADSSSATHVADTTHAAHVSDDAAASPAAGAAAQEQTHRRRLLASDATSSEVTVAVDVAPDSTGDVSLHSTLANWASSVHSTSRSWLAAMRARLGGTAFSNVEDAAPSTSPSSSSSPTPTVKPSPRTSSFAHDLHKAKDWREFDHVVVDGVPESREVHTRVKLRRTAAAAGKGVDDDDDDVSARVDEWTADDDEFVRLVQIHKRKQLWSWVQEDRKRAAMTAIRERLQRRSANGDFEPLWPWEFDIHDPALWRTILHELASMDHSTTSTAPSSPADAATSAVARDSSSSQSSSSLSSSSQDGGTASTLVADDLDARAHVPTLVNATARMLVRAHEAHRAAVERAFALPPEIEHATLGAASPSVAPQSHTPFAQSPIAQSALTRDVPATTLARTSPATSPATSLAPASFTLQSDDQLLRVPGSMWVPVDEQLLPHASHIGGGGGGVDAAVASPASRHLLDTFGDSLRFVHRLYNQAYGKEARKVPAHMPHFIDKRIMTELQSRWPAEFDATSTHRFRQSDDMQYGFSYFYFVMNELQPFSIERAFHTVLDLNGNNLLESFEIDYMGLLIAGTRPSEPDMIELKELMYNVSIDLGHDGRVDLETVLHTPDLPEVLESKLAKKKKYRFVLMSQDEIEFFMMPGNYSIVSKRLDEIRLKMPKFICLNDDMGSHGDPPAGTVKALHDFFESYYPVPSPFELPNGTRNDFQYVWEYREHIQARQSRRAYLALLGALFVFMACCITLWRCVLWSSSASSSASSSSLRAGAAASRNMERMGRVVAAAPTRPAAISAGLGDDGDDGDEDDDDDTVGRGRRGGGGAYERVSQL